MRNVICQSVVLPAFAEKLFGMYMNPSTHPAITGASVDLGDKRGSEFKAFDGALTGTILIDQELADEIRDTATESGFTQIPGSYQYVDPEQAALV